MAAKELASCGRDFSSCPDINRCLEAANSTGYTFICVPLVNPRYKREFIEGPAKDRSGPLTRSDLVLNSQDWGTLIVGKISPWIQCDSRDETIMRNSEKALRQELRYACHLGLPATMLELKGGVCYNLARMIQDHILSLPIAQMYWIRVPLTVPAVGDVFEDDRGLQNDSSDDPWKWWNTLRTLCNSHKRLGVVLDITADLPNMEDTDRWYGEPVKAIILSTSIFLTNKKGFPVLSRAHQTFIKKMFKLDAQVIITGSDRHPNKGYHTYHQYIDYVYQSQQPVDTIDQFSKGYEDHLQCPLQPLMDNLESQTYEIFEKDPVKYSQYQKAVYQALLDRVPMEAKETTVTIIMVVGAGRGPLVRASITAADRAERKVKVYAVEKNENAVITLQNYQQEVWGDTVTVVSSDMRDWEAPELADVIVSELLGSFGDNELSPECLDGAQKFLKADGISIPCQYTSYLAPLQSSKLYNETRDCQEKGKRAEVPFETPYVVRLHNCTLLGEPQPLFTFRHPNKEVPIDNSRYKSLSFAMPCETVVHGFGGYFECKLYKNINISIVPNSHSPGLFSWFPLYFPIQEPIHVSEADRLTVHYWRVVSHTLKRVWYEWAISEPRPYPIHNPNGRSYTIGL